MLPTSTPTSPHVNVEENVPFLRKELIEAYGWFLAAHQQAAEKLRSGNLSVAFPEGSFPPSLPFVGETLSFAPT